MLRERSASLRESDPSTAVARAPTNHSSRLENAVSDALRHPLDPELMREPQEEKALWSVAARFAAAIGVAAVVALFFVIVVPGVRQGGDGEASTAVGRRQDGEAGQFDSNVRTQLNNWWSAGAAFPRAYSIAWGILRYGRGRLGVQHSSQANSQGS